MKSPTGTNLARMRQYRRNISRAYPDAPAQIAEAERSRALRRLTVFIIRRALVWFVLAVLLGLAVGLKIAGWIK